MEFIQRFKNYLLSQKQMPSKATVKNYIADINHFVAWFEKKNNHAFSPVAVTMAMLEAFKQDMLASLSASSVERHMSSLRKFFTFLKLEGIIPLSPFEQALQSAPKQDVWHIKEFKDYLYVYNASRLTIKNYLIDVKQFMKWAEEVTGIQETWDMTQKDIFLHIDDTLLEEYRNRLYREKAFSPASINRKLSSLRKYLSWAVEQGYMPHAVTMPEGGKAVEPVIPQFIPQQASLQTQETPKKTAGYSPIPPVRLAQKTTKGINFLFEYAVILPLTKAVERVQFHAWKLKGKPLFISSHPSVPTKTKIQLPYVGNLSKALYAPMSISVKHLPWYRRFVHHIRYTRPQWYHKYHQYALAHYFNWAVLMIFSTAIGIGMYISFIGNPKDQSPALAALPTAPPRILSFQGRLTDTSDNPITANTNLRFAIYSDATASGSALLWQEVDNVTPDANGVFATTLGKGTTIPSSLFTQNASLYLGVAVEQTDELTPRQQLATVAYASNSETLQGLPPITQSGAGTQNVVLALNSSGNLAIGSSTTFQATSGTFTLSGNSVVINTNAGTNGNIILAPDGLGTIDLQKPLQNTSNNNNIPSAAGAVEIDDLTAILATSSGQSALTIDQNGTGPIISASASGIARFTVDNAGNTTANAFFTGLGSTYYINSTTSNLNSLNIVNNLSVSGNIGSSLIPLTTDTYDLGSDPNLGGKEWNNLYVKNIIAPSTGGINGFWQLNSGALAPAYITNDFLLGGNSTSSATFQVTSGTGSATTSGTLTFNGKQVAPQIQSTNNQTLTIGGNTTGNIFLSPLNGSGNVSINGAANISGAATITGNTTINTLGTGVVKSAAGLLTNGQVDLTTDVTKTLPVGNGGTGINAVNAGSLLYGAGSSPLNTLAIGGANTVLVSNGSAPTWSSTLTLTGLTVNGNTTLGASGSDTLTINASLVSNLLTNADNSFDIGSATNRFRNIYAYNILLPATGGIGGYWQLQNGALSPANITNDVLVGGTSTASAKFQIFSSTGNATTSGIISFNTTNTIQTTDQQTLTLGGGNTGNIKLSAKNNTGTIIFGGYSTGIIHSDVNGNLSSSAVDLSSNDVSNHLVVGKGGLGTDVTPATAGEILYSTGTTAYGHLAAGSAGSCLVANGFAAPSWGSCAAGGGGGSGIWALSPAGLIYPTNVTADFALGASATDSAKFAVININSPTNTPVASVSAQDVGGRAIFLDSAGTLQTTNNNSLTIGGNSTGNIYLKPLNGAGNVTINGLGTGVVHSTGGVLSASSVNLTSEVTNTLGVGNGGTGVNSVAAGALLYGAGTTNPLNALAIGGANTVLVSNGAAPTWSSTLTLTGLTVNGNTTLGASTSDQLSINSTLATTLVPGTNVDLGTTTAHFRAIYVDQLFSSSTGGINGFWNLLNNVLSPIQPYYDLAVGGSATGSATPFQVFSTTVGYDHAGTATTSGGLSFRGTPTYTPTVKLLNGSSLQVQSSVGGDEGLGSSLFTIANDGTLTATGTFNLNSGNLVTSTTGTANLFNTNATTVNIAGGATTQTTIGNNLGFVVLNGNVTLGNASTKSIAFNGRASTDIQPNADNARDLGTTGLAWRNVYAYNLFLPSTGGIDGFWQLNNGVLAPTNITNDLAVGGTATASAKFQVFANTGNATTSGNLTFNTNGTIQTTSMLPLVLGSATTGSIQLAPKGTTGLFVSGRGVVGIGTTTPGSNNAGNTVGATSALEIDDQTGNQSDFTQRVANGSWAIHNFAASNGTLASPTLSNSGQRLGQINFQGYDGTDYQIAAEIRSEVDDITNTGSLPGNLEFFTTPIGTISPVQRMTITNLGKVGIGTTAIGNGQLIVNQINNSGAGDLFSASSSGQTKFTIANDGTIKNALIPNATDTYNLGSDPNLGGHEWDTLYVRQIIMPGGGGGGLSGVNYWQLNSAVLAPANINYDLAIGGVATGSATPFQVFAKSFVNNAGTVPAGTATTSGNLTFTGTAPKINILNGGGLGFYASPGGDLGLPAAANPALFIASNNTVGINTTSPTAALDVNGTGAIVHGIIPESSGLHGHAFEGLGTSGTDSNFLGSGVSAALVNLIGSSNQHAGFGVFAGTNIVSPTVWMYNAANNGFDVRSVNFGVDASAGTSLFTVRSSGNVGIGTTSPNGILDVASQGPAYPSDLTLNQTGATNLITNPSFEGNSSAGWALSANQTISNASSLFGQYSIKFSGTSAIEGSSAPCVNVSNGTTYTASEYIYRASGFTGNTGIFVTYYTDNNCVTTGSASSQVNTTATDKWARVSVSFTGATGSIQSVRVRTIANGSATGTAYYDGVQLEAGTSASPYLDGSLGPGYYWTGAPNNSTSVRTPGAAFAYQTINSAAGIGAASRSNLPTLQLDQDGTGDIIAASASGTPEFRALTNGQVQARSFYDLDNTSYFIDPASATTSLNLAGGSQASWYIATGLDNSGNGGQFRAIQGNYGVMLRNDGTTTYFLHTASGSPTGVWNSDRQIELPNNSDNVYFSNNGGLVGIGNTSPNEKLDVSGSVIVDNATNPRFVINSNAVGAHQYEWYGNANGTASNLGLYDRTSAIYRMYVDGTNGRIGINGVVAPSYALHVSGDIYANGGWLRVSGNNGIYWETNGIGWFTQDSTWLRTYNNASIWAGSGNIDTNGRISIGYGGSNYVPLSVLSNSGSANNIERNTNNAFELDESGFTNFLTLYMGTDECYGGCNANAGRTYIQSARANVGLKRLSINGRGGNVDLDAGAGNFDYAEVYHSNQIIKPGELVQISHDDQYALYKQINYGTTIDASNSAYFSNPEKNIGKVIEKTTSSYSPSLVGIASTHPAVIIDEGTVTVNKGVPVDPNGSHTPPVDLAGRAPVNVSTINGPIHYGDAITSSDIPGFGMKATKPGFIVGRAMEEFDPANGKMGEEGSVSCPTGTPSGVICGQVYVYATTTWYDPDVMITDTGVYNITDTATPSADFTMPHYFTLNDALGNPVTRMGAFLEIATANLRVGAVNAQQVITNSLAISTSNITIAGQSLRDYILSVVASANTGSGTVISPVSDSLKTNLISPNATDSAIAIDLSHSRVDIKKDASGSAVASIDNQGNATFSGQLNSQNLAVNGDATVSGTLHADRIEANSIQGLEAIVSTLSAQNVTNVTNIYFATPSASSSSTATTSGSLTNSTLNGNMLNGYANIASFSAYFSYVPSLKADTAEFEQGITVLGPTSLSDTSVTGTLSVGSQLMIANRSIDVLGSDFEIQPLRQGGISFVGGLIKIDTDGNLTVNGNAIFNNNLAAKIISPLGNDSDLTIQLGQNATGSALATSQFKVNNASGSAVFAVNQLGDLVASGAATIAKLNFSLVQPALAVSNTEIVATGSAGTAAITAHQNQLTIDNPSVTANSLIYITPVGSSSQTPYLLRQVPGKSFTVGIPNQTNVQTYFNWLIVN